MSHLARRLALPSGVTLERPALARTLEEAGVNLDRFLYLRLPPGLSIEQCLKRLEHHPDLEYAEPDGIGTGGVVTPNDPNYFVQWHHRNGLTKALGVHPDTRCVGNHARDESRARRGAGYRREYEPNGV